MKKKLLIIDPGHGGWDSGAVCEDLVEKDLALDYALKCTHIAHLYPFAIDLTRYEDVALGRTKGLDLRRRVMLANEKNADLFVSIHFNAASSDEANGTEILIYPGSKEGNRFADILLEELDLRMSMLNIRGVKPGFYRGDPRNRVDAVLRWTKMPAVIWEIGFLTSIADQVIITSEFMKWILCHCLLDAVEKYFGGENYVD